jgi:2,4-dienoyl-CoA reductase-like NADH-dependent reductase (Old Yellow Enzyme family)
LELKNRVLMAPMEKNLCTADGIVTTRYIEYLVERAQADVALLRMEATYVDPVGKGRPFQAGAHSDAVIPALTRLTAAVRAAGGRTSVELAHCGRQTSSLVTGRQPVAPSAVPCVASGGFMPRALTVGEIADILERFAMAATRAQASGVDAIEIHGASGYLINAFMSPYTNLRGDQYGGSLGNRMRFPLEVVAAVSAAVGPEMPLIYRMSADDCVPGGVTIADSGPLATALERAGVDLIDVSAGTYESILATQPPMEAGPGTLVALAAKIKTHVSIPVATAGKLVHLGVAERAVSGGDIDFVTVGRGLHADPELLTRPARVGLTRCDAASPALSASRSWGATSPPIARSTRRRFVSGRCGPGQPVCRSDLSSSAPARRAWRRRARPGFAATTCGCSSATNVSADRSDSVRWWTAAGISRSRSGFLRWSCCGWGCW